MRKYHSKRAIAEELARTDQAAPDHAGGGTAAGELSRESIEQLAYQYWLNRGCPTGSAEEDWYQAERALLAAAQMGGGEGEPRAGAVMRAGG